MPVKYKNIFGIKDNIGLEIQGRGFNSQAEALELHFFS